MSRILSDGDGPAVAASHPGLPPAFLLTISGLIAGAVISYRGWTGAIGLIALGCLFRWPVQCSFGLLAFVLPFDNVSAVGTADTGPALTRYVAGIAAFILLSLGLVTKRIAPLSIAALWLSIFVLWAALTVGWALDPQLVWSRMPTAFSLLFLYLVASSFRITRDEMSFVIMATILGGLAAALMTLSQSFSGNLFQGTLRGSLVVGGRETDPNQLVASLLLPLSLCIGVLLQSRHPYRRISAIVAAAAIGLAVLFTMSRGGLIAVIILVFVCMHRLRANKRIFLAVACLASLLLFMPHSFFERLSFADRGAGRFDIWVAGLGLLPHYGIFGAGVDNFVVAYNSVAGDAPMFRGFGRGPHNIYLGATVEVGIIGLACLLLAFRAQLREARNRSLVQYEAACWAMMAIGFTLDLVWRKAFWFCWILMAMATRLAQDESTRLTENQNSRRTRV